MMIEDLKPGRVVEVKGDLFLIEDMTMTLTMQRIDSALTLYEDFLATGESQCHAPTFMIMTGRPSDPVFDEEQFKPLFTQDEL